MKPIKSLLLVAALAVPALAPSVASAQPGGYYNAPPPNSVLPGGFHNRQGRLAFGFSAGLGGMHDDFGDITCDNCDTVSGQIEGHIGGFVGPQLALMFEAQLNFQQIAAGDFATADVFLNQSAAMVAAQYWLTPQLWVKGGLGFANLQITDDFGGQSQPENGFAMMGAIGYELFSARYMAIDLQGRLINGSYDSINNNITAGSIGVGINWY